MAHPVPAGPAFPEEPEEPTPLGDAQAWLDVYDKYLQKVGELARAEGLEDQMQPWIARCARRRDYWVRARDRMQRLDQRGRLPSN